MNKSRWIVYLLIMGITFSCNSEKYTDPLTPEEALASFQLNADFEVQVFAAEPFVKDPVAMVFGDDGHAYVAEMPDYPYQPEPGKGNGRIKVLFDRNKDGRVDSAVVFADNLSMPTSMLPWKGGLIVTAAPNIVYLKDTTGDYESDMKTVLFTGFFNDNMEAQITALRFNIDNWVYAANYGREGEVTEGQDGSQDTLLMGGADFRFRLDKDLFERESGVGQFGQAIDDWGHRFLNTNSWHIKQPVIPWRYLHRHAFMPPSEVTLDISDHDQIMYQITDAPYWRAERTKRRNATYKKQGLDRIEYADDHFTGAAGSIVYGGDAFLEKYHGNFFVAEVAGNLVHRDVLIPADSSPHYIAKLGVLEKDKEFLASTDPWFRPTSFTVGEDGCLYIVDMYRQHIETPFAIPEDLKKDMDFMNGSEYGRIYRIVPRHKTIRFGQTLNFSEMKSSKLVQFLSHPNRNTRLRAQRILVERQDKSIVPQLKSLIKEAADPRYELHALYLLEALDALNVDLVKRAIRDGNHEIREAGIRLGEQFPECFSLILNSVKDTSIQVAFQAVLSAGNDGFEKTEKALADALKKYGYDPFFRTAILSSETGGSINFFEMLVQQQWFDEPDNAGQSNYLEDFSFVIGWRNNTNEVVKFLQLISNLSNDEKYKIVALKGMSKGLSNMDDNANLAPTVRAELQRILQTSNDSEVKSVIQNLVKTFDQGNLKTS